MEDVFSVAYQQTEDEKDLEYAYFGIFDGHGGREAALYAKEHLMDHIVRQKGFWSNDDDSICRAIHEGFVQTHQAMWKELENWPKTASGLPSTAGTTASIAFIRRGKIYVGHVGDSAIVLGSQDPKNPDQWTSKYLTQDHKPESAEESQRIFKNGGKVVAKSGVPRVVWNRPKMGHKGPVRRSTPIDEIPFLAVARSLGDLWSYNSENDTFVVSPEPDTFCYTIDITKERCLILGTDGCWNMLTASQAVNEVCSVEKSNEQHMLNPSGGRQWINPSKRLVDKAIDRWVSNNLGADNTSVVTVMLDPPGPPRAQVLKKQREVLAAANIRAERGSMAIVTNREEADPLTPIDNPGLSIISRFPNAANIKERNLADPQSSTSTAASNRILNERRDPYQRGELCRLSGVARLNNKLITESPPKNESEDSDSDATTVCPDDDNREPGEFSVESLEANNPEEKKSPPSKRTSSRGKSSSAAVPETPKLSRELSALQLTGRASQLLSSPRRGRTRSASESHSDTENEAPNPDNTPTKSTSSTKKGTSKVNPKFVRSKEAKVQKSASISLPSPSTATPTTVMSLRPRGISEIITPTSSSRKRKIENLFTSHQELPSTCAAKSPKLTPTAVIKSKPVMTRSRTAKVLRLKK